ncbi:MAG: glycosyltransferase, partial [Bacteroidetes bacterium]|nr:glycosyltransferase [Bacteroidota bacterium]
MSSSPKIAVLLLVRNNEVYLQHLFTFLNDSPYSFYIYENNSTDNTVEICNQFLLNHPGKLWSENLNEDEFMVEGTQFERIERITNARNKLLDYVKDDIKLFDWCLFIDTDIFFDNNTISNILSRVTDNGVMYCCNALEVLQKNNADNLPENVNFITERHYYDTFAYVNNNNIMCYPYCTNTDCLYNYCKQRTITVSEPTEIVRSAWGGLVLIKTSVFNHNYIKWKPLMLKDNNSLCEHIYFCDMVGTIGDIIRFNDIYIYRKHSFTKSFNVIYLDNKNFVFPSIS